MFKQDLVFMVSLVQTPSPGLNVCIFSVDCAGESHPRALELKLRRQVCRADASKANTTRVLYLKTLLELRFCKLTGSQCLQLLRRTSVLPTVGNAIPGLETNVTKT